MRAKGDYSRRAFFCAHVLVVTCFAFSAPAQTTAPNEWTWSGGSNAGAEAPVTGTLGTPAIGNIPAARYQATNWTDKSGNFWLFGGTNCTSCAGGYDLELNDLWEFNPSANEWGWMAGSSAGGQTGVYGTMSRPSAQNTPGGREGASSWTDSKGNLWLFGGYGLDANGNFAILNDLWEFSPSTGEWTWMSGSSTVSACFNDQSGNTVGAIHCAEPSTYGTLGTAAPGNTPGSRQGAITWTDKNGNLWLFGGWSFDIPNQVQYYFDELWEYNPSTNLWAWMGGSSTRDGSACDSNVNLWYYTCGEPGVYGTLGAPASGNIPGGRSDAISWSDSSGNLWLFSGLGFDVNGYIGDTQDLWKFSPSTGQWSWIGGNGALIPCADAYVGGGCSSPAVYGTLGVPAAGNIPVGRDHGVGWSDSSGNLWLFGGGTEQIPNNINNGNEGFNDLWEFSPATNQWTVMGGSISAICGIYCGASQIAVYGTLGSAAPGDEPGARFAPAGWTDSNGNFWLFGGEPPPDESGGRSVFDNDLWEYQPANGPLPTTATPIFSVPTGSYGSAQSVTIGDATNGAFIYYTTDGTTPTINSTIFFPSTSAPINVQHSETLKAIAVAPGCLDSAVGSGVYTLPPQAATPTFSLPSGTYTSFQTVTISDPTPGATIYYTIGPSAPTTSSNVYNGPITVSSSETLQAVAIASGYSLSNVSSASYMLNLPTATAPTFSVGYGTYNTPQTVTLSDSTPGATIYYQINTGYPTTSSPVYTGPITVSSTESIWAMATAPNYFGSGFAGGVYLINPSASQTATPTFSAPAGTYSAVQTVSISDVTNGASIYYTTDGSTPTTTSTVYTGPITVSSSETLQAVGEASGDAVSAVASAAYTINLPPPSFSITGTAVSVAPGATTGNSSTITLTPSNGFTGVISLSCAISPTAASDPATCSIPSSVSFSGSAAQTTTLTVNTTSATSAINQIRGFIRPVVGGAALACLLLVGIPVRRRRWRSVLGMLILLIAVVGATLGCSGGANGDGGGGGGNSGTTPGTYVITVSGTSGSITQTGTVSLTVQ